MFEDHNNAIYDILLTAKLLDKQQLDELNETRNSTGKSLADAAVDSGLVEKPQLLEAIAKDLKYEYEPIPPADIREDIYRQLRPNLARTYGVVPIRVDDTSITLLAKDPFNNAVIDDLTFTLNKDVNLVVTDPAAVDTLIVQCYGEENSSIDDLLSEISQVDFGDDAGENDAANLANETPIIRFVNLILQQAIRDKASDIHFEPFEDQFRIRYRIDGALYEMAPPPKSLALPVISRIKVLANLNIAENRIPQDGRIKMTISGRPVDLRVSTLPTQFGESVVLRVLDKSVVNLDLEKLSMTDEIMNNIRRLVKMPNGIFIVTGPTGSGKTTTLYSALREVNTVDVKILTSEDPVEYEIDGIMQVQTTWKPRKSPFRRPLRGTLFSRRSTRTTRRGLLRVLWIWVSSPILSQRPSKACSVSDSSEKSARPAARRTNQTKSLSTASVSTRLKSPTSSSSSARAAPTAAARATADGRGFSNFCLSTTRCAI